LHLFGRGAVLGVGGMTEDEEIFRHETILQLTFYLLEPEHFAPAFVVSTNEMRPFGHWAKKNPKIPGQKQ
jgi:hypothetical protein